jgi:hypothetical protein
MNRPSKRLIFSLALISTLAIGGVAMAQAGGGFFGMPGQRFARVLEKLNLSDQQENLALDIRDEIHRQGKGMRQQHQVAMETVITELEKPKPDAQKLNALADQQIDNLRKMVHVGIDKFLTLHATFSDQQRRDFSAELRHMQDMAKRMHESKE